MFLVRMGITDNWGGIIGGMSEVAAVGTRALKFSGSTSLMEGLGAFAGSAGAFANAMQNWDKAAGKLREGDMLFGGAYLVVFTAYGFAGAALFLNGVAILAEWLVKRLALRIGLGIAAAIAFGVEWLPYIGWAITIVAFLIEGLVAWFDRTKMEEWVKACYFGDHDFKDWQHEEGAFDAAMKDMQEQALRAAEGEMPEGAK